MDKFNKKLVHGRKNHQLAQNVYINAGEIIKDFLKPLVDLLKVLQKFHIDCIV